VNLTLSDHARKRAAEMLLPEWLVLRIFEEPDATWPCRYPGRNGEPLRKAAKGRYAIAYDPESGVIITILVNDAGYYARPEEAPPCPPAT
jgi:hypothetical protein